jgi:ribosome-binding factor A
MKKCELLRQFTLQVCVEAQIRGVSAEWKDYMKKNSIKNTRINGEVQKVLSSLISREIKDPRINPMTSVVNVEVSPDLKTAKVYISVLGDEESKEATRKGLKSAASFMRGQLAKSLNLRNTPELTFIIDNSIEYGVHMSHLIDEVNKNLSHHEEQADSSEEESDEEMDTDEEE